MDIIYLFQTEPFVFCSFVAILGLLIGSFLNVVILRMPIALKQDWRKECYEYLELSIPISEQHELPKNYSIMFPRSYCPKCKNQLRAIDNIPLFSYLFLKGKCHFCKEKISLRYPIIEAITSILMVMVAIQFGVTWQTVAGCILTCVLIVQSGIDIDHKMIPDEITMPILWLGILLSLFSVFTTSEDAIIGAASGYLTLWVIYWVFYLVTKKEGMGYGDFKLLAMLGAFLGWQILPVVLILSSFLGSLVGITLLVFKACDRETKIPFGPFLAIAGWVALVFGPQINNWYLSYIGIA